MTGSQSLPRWRALPPLALGVFMATVDISAVNIALPTLARTFGEPLTRIEWVVLAYVVTITGLLLACGRLADRWGRRRMYATGLAVFTLASALCAAAPTSMALFAARALQGLGAAMMTANSSALLVSSFPEGERGRALGAFGAMVGVGLALGPVLGGLVVERLSWRWIFLGNLPLGLLALWQLHARVPRDPPAPTTGRLDVAGTVTWFAALVALMLGLTRGPERGWSSLGVQLLLGASVVLFAAFGWIERRAEAPLLPPGTLRGPVGAGGLLTLVGQALAIVAGVHLPLYLEGVAGFDAAQTGRWLAVLPLAALVLAPLAGRWSDRAGFRPVATLGMAITALGFFVLSGLGLEALPLRLLLGLALVGTGLGLFTVPNASAMLSHVPPQRLGLASGLQATMRNLGFATGAAAAAAIVASRVAAYSGASASLHAPLTGPALALATRDLFRVMAVVAALCIPWVASRPDPRASGPAPGSRA